MNTRQQTQAKPGLSRFVWIGLVVSLMVNAGFVGLAIGKAVYHRPPPVREFVRQGDFAYNPLAILPLLSVETRRQVLREAAPDRRVFRTHIKSIRAAREGVLEAIGADPFDGEAYRQAMLRAQEADMQARQQAIDVLVGIMNKVPPQERAELLQKLKSGRAFGRPDHPAPHPGRAWDGGPPPPPMPMPPPGGAE